MKENVLTLARVNNQGIVLIEFENGEKFVPIRPICDALGISYQGQIDKIKDDEILSPTLRLNLMIASDGKEREMQSIPYKFILGWLFTINAKNVPLNAQAGVLKYKMECYEVLYNHFFLRQKFLEWQNEELNRLYGEKESIREDFKFCKTRLKDKDEEIQVVRSSTFETWRVQQTVINFEQAGLISNTLQP